MSMEDAIIWSPDRMLSRSDFKADANPAAYENAHSVVGYKMEWTLLPDPENGTSNETYLVVGDVRILTVFKPMLSWVRPLHHGADLRHQQGHFDLGELVMRKMLPDIRGSYCGRRFLTRGENNDQRMQFAKEDSARILEPAIRTLEGTLAKMQTKYDEATAHGENATAQSEYDAQFAALRV